MSDIRVSVQWKNSTVFAGEDVECTITFKNISQTRSLRRSPSPSSQLRSHSSPRERWKETLPMRSAQNLDNTGHRNSPSLSGLSQPRSKLHKQALSLSTSNGLPQAPLDVQDGMAKGPRAGNNKHKRSVSIVSLGGETTDQAQSPGPVLSSVRPGHGHARAASLQILPRHTGTGIGGSISAPTNGRAFTVPSPLFRSSTSFAEQRISLNATLRSSPLTGLDTGNTASFAGKKDRNSISSFKFPQVPSINEVSVQASALPKKQTLDLREKAPPHRPSEFGNGLDRPNPATRILSPASTDGTPRSSGEFYSMSNNSTETLASEYVTPENTRIVNRPAHSRQGSYLAPARTAQPEILMMGYGQIVGSFTLDGSLVNQSPFEEVKKKGIVGGQGGGGVVRNESAKRDSGMLGSLGWGSIGASLGGLLGGNELSSIKETSSSTNAKSVPVLSTPQSILFVDLRLAPGESKSYKYVHPLPKGIPPTHKGRAMKISYSLVVGTQRTAKMTQQHLVQHANIPFRVLTSVNGHGEVLGHDLMSPRTILSNTASIASLDNLQQAGALKKDDSLTKMSSPSLTDFLSYINSLLNKPHKNSDFGLLSPTEPSSRSHTPMGGEPGTMKESIDLAILKSNIANSSKQSTNRFKINRSGDRVAVIMLARPAYRLGEAVPVAVDFADSDVPCYALHATLESSEIIDPAIALRSKASIHRVTRRIHASQTECTVSAKKVLFNPTIPSTATPEFITSGISLEWSLRFVFVTSRLGDAEESDESPDDLMDEVARDERGSVNAAVQVLLCESFDVTVPLRVYGAVGFDEKTEAGDFPI